MLVRGFWIVAGPCTALLSELSAREAKATVGVTVNTGNVRWECLVGGGKEDWWNLWRRCHRR